MPGHDPVSNQAARGRRESAPTGEPLDVRIEQVPGYRPIADGRESASAAGPRDAAEVVFALRAQRENVLGTDDRVAVARPADKAPFRHICALRIHTGRHGALLGTGWFVSPRVVITAAHNVHTDPNPNAPDEGWARSVEVIPALDGAARPYASQHSKSLHAPDGWTLEGDPEFDYGAIVLATPMRDVGWFGVGPLLDGSLRGAPASICGYPADKPARYHPDAAKQQYFHRRGISRVTARSLYYDVDTFGGQSGSPIWVTVGEKRIVVGIHTTGGASENRGVRIIRPIFDNIRGWVARAS